MTGRSLIIFVLNGHCLALYAAAATINYLLPGPRFHFLSQLGRRSLSQPATNCIVVDKRPLLGLNGHCRSRSAARKEEINDLEIESYFFDSNSKKLRIPVLIAQMLNLLRQRRHFCGLLIGER